MPPADAQRVVRVLSTKYDGSPHYEFEAQLLGRQDGYIRLHVPQGTSLRSYRGEFPVQTTFTALFWTDRWYNVYHNYRPAGRRGIESYANVSTPAQFDGETLRWVDLDLDVLTRDGGIEVDDEDEFADHRVRFGYPDEVIRHALAARDELLRLAESGAFPFDRASHIPGGEEG